MDLDLTKHLVVLRGEYAIAKGGEIAIASPNAKDGMVLALSDAENCVVALAHFDGVENFENNLGAILIEMSNLGANLEALKGNLMGRGDVIAIEKVLGMRGIVADKESWSGTHPYNVIAKCDGEISVNNSSDLTRRLLNHVLFTKSGEERVSRTMSSGAINFLNKV